MTSKPTMITKTSWLVFGRVVCHALSLIFYICLARRFGEAGIGNYSYAFGIAALFGVGVQLGLRHLVTRNIAQDPHLAQDYYGNLFMLQLGMTILLGIILYGVTIMLNYSQSLQILTILAFVGLALKAMGIGYIAFLEAVEEMGKSAILEILLRLTIVALGFTLIFVRADLEWIMGVHVIGGIVYVFLARNCVSKRFKTLKMKLNIPFIKSMLIAALPFTFAATLYVLYARVDIIMLLHFRGEIETGAYAAAFRCIESLFVVSAMAGIAMYPVMSQSGSDAKEQRDQLFLSSLKWLGFFGMLGTILLITVGNKVFLLFFGEKFTTSATLIQWMSILLLIGYIKVPYWRLLFATHREKLQLKIQSVSIFLNIVLNFFLIPQFGVYGAVWASIASEGLLLLGFHIVCRNLVQGNYFKMAIRLIAAGILGLFIGISGRDFLPWPIMMLILMILVIAICVFLKFFTVNDYKRVFHSMRASKALCTVKK